MKHKNLFIGMGLLLLLVLLSVISVQAAGPKTLYLDWRQVVPAGSGDPNMFGDATVSVNGGQARLCYTMRVFLYPSSLWPPTGAGIYKAPAGSNGPLVVDLQPDFATESPSGCLAIDSALAHDMHTLRATVDALRSLPAVRLPVADAIPVLLHATTAEQTEHRIAPMISPGRSLAHGWSTVATVIHTRCATKLPTQDNEDLIVEPTF